MYAFESSKYPTKIPSTDLKCPFRLMALGMRAQHLQPYVHSQSMLGFFPQRASCGDMPSRWWSMRFLTKLTVCMADTQNFLGRSASYCKVSAPSCSFLLCLAAMPLCSGVYSEVVSCMIPSLPHICANSFPVYSPRLSVRIFFTSAFF